MLSPVSGINFRIYAPNFTSNQKNKIINFREAQRRAAEKESPEAAQEETFGALKKAATIIQACKNTMDRRDDMLDEAVEIFHAWQFGQLIDYADSMDDDNIDVITHGDWEDVIISDNNGNVKSKSYYKNGVLGGFEKLDKDGNRVSYDIKQTKQDDTVFLDIKKRTYGALQNSYTTLNLAIKDDKPYSYTDRHLFYLQGENSETYEKRLYFSSFDGRPIRYEEGFRLLKNGNMQINKVLKENSFQTRYTQYADGSEKADSKLVFTTDKNGHIKKLKRFESGTMTDNDGFKTMDKSLVFDERGVVKTYLKNYRQNSRGHYLTGSEYSLFEGDWLKVR